MPIYEYRCASCGFEEEYLQKVSAPALTECPKCHAATYIKKLTAAGFQLKGSGWYATDFKNNASGKAGKENQGGGDAKESKDKKDSGGESKSESKASESKSSESKSSESKSSESKSSESKASDSGSSKASATS
jgi:putative FmdB family regulatory protein